MTRRYTSEIVNEIGPEKDIPGARPRHDARGDGLDLRHLLDEPGPFGARASSPASRSRSAARSAGSRRPHGALLLPPGGAAERGLSLQGLAVAIQGFGNVGAQLARLVAAEGASVVAVSDSSGGRLNERGIDVDAALAHKSAGGSISELADGDAVTNEELLGLPSTCSRPVRSSTCSTRETRWVSARRSSSRVQTDPQPRRPTRSSRATGCSSLPDVLANGGGVVVATSSGSRACRSTSGRAEEVNARLSEIVARAFERRGPSRGASISMRSAAYGLAVTRVAEASLIRGLYP